MIWATTASRARSPGSLGRWSNWRTGRRVRTSSMALLAYLALKVNYSTRTPFLRCHNDALLGLTTTTTTTTKATSTCMTTTYIATSTTITISPFSFFFFYKKFSPDFILFSLSALQYLFLDRNELTGCLPSAVQNLSNLQVLSLSSNSLQGTIPSTLSSIKSLIQLFINNNQLTGTAIRIIYILYWKKNFLGHYKNLEGSTTNAILMLLLNNKLSFTFYYTQDLFRHGLDDLVIFKTYIWTLTVCLVASHKNCFRTELSLLTSA